MGKEQWSKRTIDKLLTNEKYIGTVLLSDSVTEGQMFQMKDSHPPIIIEDVFHTAQEARKKRSNVVRDEDGKAHQKKQSIVQSERMRPRIRTYLNNLL